MSFVELIAIILFADSLICCGNALRLCSRMDKDAALRDNEKRLIRLSKNAGIYWLLGLILLALAAILGSLN